MQAMATTNQIRAFIQNNGGFEGSGQDMVIVEEISMRVGAGGGYNVRKVSLKNLRKMLGKK